SIKTDHDTHPHQTAKAPGAKAPPDSTGPPDQADGEGGGGGDPPGDTGPPSG
ncbi:hypothetical protein IDM40_25540, partial [Nocardiopsis sp. HNM0947]|nr:hypothetical protein [Nocardiopsis coralli]